MPRRMGSFPNDLTAVLHFFDNTLQEMTQTEPDAVATFAPSFDVKEDAETYRLEGELPEYLSGAHQPSHAHR